MIFNKKKNMLEGLLKGPSHENGGIKFRIDDEIQEAEGGEFVVRKKAVEVLRNIYGDDVFDKYINKGLFPIKKILEMFKKKKK